MPTFAKDAPVDHRKGNITKDASGVFTGLEAEALDGTGVLDRGPFPILAASISGIYGCTRRGCGRGWLVKRGVGCCRGAVAWKEEEL